MNTRGSCKMHHNGVMKLFNDAKPFFVVKAGIYLFLGRDSA